MSDDSSLDSYDKAMEEAEKMMIKKYGSREAWENAMDDFFENGGEINVSGNVSMGTGGNFSGTTTVTYNGETTTTTYGGNSSDKTRSVNDTSTKVTYDDYFADPYALKADDKTKKKKKKSKKKTDKKKKKKKKKKRKQKRKDNESDEDDDDDDDDDDDEEMEKNAELNAYLKRVQYIHNQLDSNLLHITNTNISESESDQSSEQ